MKRVLLLSIALAAHTPAFAQSGGMKGMDMKADKGEKRTVHKATGVVTKTDKNQRHNQARARGQHELAVHDHGLHRQG
jgi:hypothetical protein